MPSEFGFVVDGQILSPDGRKLSYAEVVAIDQALCAQSRTARIHEVMAARNMQFQAAADYLGPGALEVPKFESQILDMVRRRGYLGQRITPIPATGHPSRYFEQRLIVAGGFVDPRLLAPTPGSPQKAERSVPLKAVAGAMNYGMFDIELTRQQGQYPQLAAKDLTDMVEGSLRTSDIGLWNGSDTSLDSPTTAEYCGAIRQINRSFSVASNASAVDATKTEVASMMSSRNVAVRPTAIYGHPLALDVIDQEERQNHNQLSTVGLTDRSNNVIAGVNVMKIATQAGDLPLIPDWSMPAPAASTIEAGKTDYTIAILTEPLVEYHYLTAAEPRVFVLGLQNNLATQYVCVMFGAPVFKGKAEFSELEGTPVTYAHSIGTIVR